MPEANKPIDFSDLATPVKQGEGLDFSDLATKATSQPEVESAQDYEKRGGFFSNNEFARAVARSTANSAASVLDFVRTFADSDSLKSTADSLSNLARNIPSKASSLDDVMDDPSLIPAYVAKVVGELAPQAVMAYLSGGTGAALGRAAGLGTAGVRAATGAGAAATSIPQEVGQIARETEELTGSIDSAAALGYGIPSGALDAMSAERILGKVFQAGQPSRRAWRQVVRDTLKEIPKSAATEGLTEAAQEGLHILADKAADQTFDVLTEENAKRLLESAVAGAIGGGVLGGGMSLAQLPVQKAARNEAAKNIRLTRGLEREIRTALSDLKERPATPVREPDESELEYDGGEMPRTPAVWPTTDRPQQLDKPIAPPPAVQPEPPTPAPPAAIVPLEEPPKPAKKIPGNWVITVQPPEDLDENTVMPGNVQVVIPGESETSTSPTIDSLKAAGYDVPNYMALPKGTYTSAEAEMMLVMTPEELKRYAKERKAQAHPISEQTSDRLVEKEQAKSVPPNPEGVRPATPTPAPEVPSGLIEVKDISKLPPSAGDLTKHKSRIKVQNDPGKAKAGVKAAGEVEVLMTISPNAKRSSGMLLIQTDQDVPRTIWSAKVSDLTQAGVAEPVSGGTRYRINLEKLWNSGLLKKTDRSNLAAYKLPNEKLERNVDLGADAVVEESAKLSPFLGAVLANLRDSGILTMAKVHALAGAKTGGHEYAGKTAAKLAAQVNKFILTVINEELRDGSRNIDTLSSTQKRELLGIAQAREKIESNEPFTPEDTQALANYLSNVSEVSVVDKPENEVPIDDVRGSSFGGDEDGEGSDSNPVGATWDPARTDSIIGVIEDKNPKLYQSFEADPEDDKAWESIEQELVKFLNGDKVGAEILAEAVRAKRMEGWIASPGQAEGSEFEEHNWLTGLSATGKDGILALFNNRNIHLDPELRRIGLALLNRISPEYLEHLTFGVDLNGGFDGEFIPWLKTARVAINSTNAEAAAHELSHYLAQFLTGRDRGKVAAMRAAELALVRQDPANKEFVDWLDKQGGSARSIDYARFKYGEENVAEVQGAASIPDRLYHLINDDEYFAHYMSEAAGRIKDPEFKSIVQRVLDSVKQLLDAVKEWFGNRDAYFNNLIRKFEKGQFLVHENGGMLWDRNNGERPNSLPPIKSLPAIRQFDKVDQGQEEKQLVNTLTIEQNQPLVGHVIGKLQELDRRVRAELPGITSRAAALVEAGHRGGARGETPLRHYAVLVNGLGIQEEARELTNKIQALVDEVKKQNLQAGKVSDAEQRASFLEETAKELISNYKNYLLSEQRSSKNAGVAEGLVEAIKSIDSMRDSTESLKRALEFLAQTMSLEELMADQSTQAIVNKFKEKIMAMTGASTWQQAVIPAGGERPGISNEQLRIAVRIMQERQSLVQDIITYKELSDPELVKIMTAGEIEFGNEIASLTYQKLRSFLKSYYSVRNKKDKARNIYLKHRARINKLIDDMQNKLEAEEFIYSDVIGSEQFQSAMAEAASKGFMSAELVRDNSGSDVLKRTYFNPLNKEEKIEIIDGTTKEDYERNIDNYDKVATWYEEALEDEKLDPLDKEAINFELARIYETEMNPSYNPEMGKRSPGLLNAPNILSNFTGSSLSFAMQKIGGRAAIQTSAVFQARSEARRRASEVRHDLQYPMQKSILEAARSHGINISRWRKEVAEPVLASFNSIGSRPIKAGDETRYGQKVSGKDMAAVQQMKKFSDAMTKASSDMDLHTAKLHPVKVKEVVAGKEILRPQQGGTELIMPRRFNQSFIQLLENWSKVKNNRKLNEAITDLVNLVQQGAMFDEALLPHIYSTQRFADYSNATAFGKAYREIYHSIQNRTAPTSFNQVVDIVFDSQAGTEVNKQVSKDDIIKSIIGELDQMANKVLEQQARDRAANTPGSSMQILSGDNFMTKSRGQMIAPDSGYQYSVIDQKDIRWMTTSVLEVHEQLARDGLEKIKRMLQDYINEWSNRDKHADPQKESRARQISGEDWMNYREAKQMLNQINLHLDKTSPDAFRSFLDEQFGSTARKLWSIIVQSLLQSASVLKNNMLGMDLRLIQFDQQWRGDGLWMGMPKWLLKLPTIAKNGIVMPMVDLPAYLMTSSAYRKAKKKLNINGLVGEDALNAIMHSPQLFQIATAQVKASILKRAVNAQRAKELGAAGPYGARNQIERYFTMHTLGGEFIDIDDSAAGKVKGSINSLLGIFQETGGGVMLPRALAPRKLEQFLNFQAIRYADRLIEELTGNLQQAIIDRRELGITDSPITDAELLGDSHASGGEAMYMRSIFNKAGLNIDALIKKLESNPDRPLLEPSQWNSFVLEVAKEMNMPASDNRVTYKSGFARLMSSLMGYGMWYNERLAEAMAGNSRKKIDPAAIYRGMFFVGAIIAMGVLVGTPVQRLIKRLLYDEDDQTGKFSSDSTAWRNAGVLWEQTAPFWPIIGSLMSQLYDARSGGGKIFNFLPISVASQALQFANEVGQTGNAFYPAVKFFKTIDPNLKIILNRLPSTEGLTDINSAARSLRSVADGNIELRTQKGGAAIKYSPVSTQIQMAVNEIVKDEPDYSAINHYRDDAVKYFMKHGSSREDAQRRFDLSVLARFPQNSVYGRTLSARERLQQVGRMTTDQAGRLSKVENAFDRYATTYGMRKPSEPRVARTSSGGITPTLSGRLRRRRSRRLTRNRSLARRRTRRLTRTR